MRRHVRLLTAAAALAAVATAGLHFRSAAQDKGPAPKAEPAKDEAPGLAAVRKAAAEFVKHFNAGDAKACAAHWTKDGEFIAADGDIIRGREAIEKDFAEFFTENPKATADIDIQSVRLLGRHTAVEEGTLKVRLPGAAEPNVTRYSALHVLEDDGWRMATAQEWVPDPAELTALKDVEWLVGSWAAKSGEVEARLTYAWDDSKTFLRGEYTVTTAGKVTSSGTQTIGKDPNGGLRSWQFDASGSFGEWAWAPDGGKWVIEAGGTLAEGIEVTAVNLLVPVGKDAFTWQSVERTAGGAELPDLPPIQVTRVAGK